MSQPRLSVIIITKNEAQRIRHCLDSIRWADEIIVLDSGSLDDTVAICREYTDKVYITDDWPGFGHQKNRALAKAQGEWVFSIDADEWVADSLKQEISAAITANETFSAFFIPRHTRYLGHWVDHGDPGKDKVLRLFRRDCGKFSENIVHENVEISSGQIGQLRAKLCHDSYRTLEELLERMNWYSTLTAQMRFAKGKRSSLSKAVFSAIWAFIKGYLLYGGFLDGRIGFIVAVHNAESSYYRHLKLSWLAQNKK